MSSTDIILNRANVALARSQRLVASWLPPQTTEEQSSNTKSEEELQKEEDEIFTAVPETLGVGAPLPSRLPDGSWNRAELDSNDTLRRQLLGKNYQKVMKEKEREKEARQKASAASASASGDANNSISGVNNEAVEEDSYDEEDGRTAAVGRKFVKGQGQGQSQGLAKNQEKKNNKKRKAAEEQSQSQAQSETAGAASGDNPEQEGQEVVAQGDDQEDSSAKQDAKTSGSSSRPAPRRKKATSFLDEILAERSKKRKKR